MTLISVVIPCYKSTKSIEELASHFFQLKEKNSISVELIFVNDSPFYLPTGETLNNVKSKYDFVKIFQLRKNIGQQLAILVGLSQASGDFVITMDDDLQHPVSEVPKLVNEIKKNIHLDAIFAIPKYKDKKHSLWRNFGSYLLNKIDTFFLKKPKGLTKSAFKIITRDLNKVLINNYNSKPTISSLIISSTSNIKNLDVKHDKRKYDKGNYKLTKLIDLSLDSILHYSSLPLRFIGFLGVFSLILSFFYIIFIIIQKVVFNINIPGFATTVILISFFGGFNLFSLGIIGEYLIRIIKEQQKVNLNDFIKY